MRESSFPSLSMETSPSLPKTDLRWMANSGNLGAKVYLFFAGCMAAIIAITYFVFPELKGRTAAEVDEMFEARVPARKFSGERRPPYLPWPDHLVLTIALLGHPQVIAAPLRPRSSSRRWARGRTRSSRRERNSWKW